MVAEVFDGLSALKSAFDLAKGLKDMDDAIFIAVLRVSAILDQTSRLPFGSIERPFF
jgi:hypothetical protein